MSRMMDADKFLSWLSEIEGEIRKEKMKECQPDRYDDGLMAATGTIREYVEKMCKIAEAEAMEKLAEFEEKEKCGEWLDAIELAKIAIALQSQKWIPCSERLPEDNTDVIVCFYSGIVTEMRYWENGNFQGIYEHTTKSIVAWMPLPEPYREGE